MGGVVLALGMIVAAVAADDAAERPKADKAPTFTLKDSYDKSFTLSFPRAKPVVVTFGDEMSGHETHAWRNSILERYGDRIEFKSVAWLELIPSLMRGTVQRIIKETYDWVLLDWSGDTARRFRCKASVANIFIIDGEGTILLRFHGAASKKGLERAYAALDAELESGE